MATRTPPQVDIDALVPEVKNYLNGPPDEMIISYLRIAAKQFCQDSRMWRQMIGTIEVAPPTDPNDEITIPIPSVLKDDGTRDLTLPDDSYLNTISFLELNIGPANSKELAVEKTYRYDVVFQEMILSAGLITNTTDVTVTVILEPSFTAILIPNFLVERNAEGIRDYALYSMMKMKGREWTDPKLAQDHKVEYEARVAEAKIDRAREGTEQTIELELIPFN